MTSIRISADASPAISVFDQIRRSIERTRRAGDQFSKTKIFDHPELKDFADTMRQMQAQFGIISRLYPNSSLMRGIRSSGQEGRAPWQVDWEKAFPDPHMRQRQMNYLSQWPAFHPGGIAATSEASGGGLGAGGMGTIAAVAKRILPLAIGGGVVASMFRGITDANQVNVGTDKALRWSALSKDFDVLREEMRKVGESFGVAGTEATKFAQ